MTKMTQENNGQNQNQVKPEEEMTKEELDALHADEEFISNFNPADLADDDKRTELEKRLTSAKTTIAQKRHYQGKVKDGKTSQATPPQPAPSEKKKEDDKGADKGIDPQVATDFRLDHPELSKEQAKKVIAHATAYGVTPEEALKDPLMQQYIASTNAVEDVEGASPPPRSRGAGGVADKDWSTATPEEMAAARTKIMHPNG